ncbi:hypothetical protein P3W45_001596 [Vairimorpha bombi]|jgi:GPI mannosyltransferase 2
MKLSKSEIFYRSITARIFYLSLSLLFHYSFPHFDKSSSFFLYKWDSVFFDTILQKGYTSEHQLAFFPLLPILTKSLTTGIPTYLSEILVNLLISSINSILLYTLSLKFFDPDVSEIALYFFIYNPCSIILSAFYTESLFMLIFLVFIHEIMHKNVFRSAFLISLSCLCRSNGVLFVYFICANNFLTFLISLFIVCLPISTFQIYSLSKIFGYTVNRIHKSSLDKYLSDRVSIKLFVPYSYIQREYWGQGIFKFYTLNNIPNLLIGLPFISFTIVILYTGYKLECKNKDIIRQMCNLLSVQTIISVLFLHLNMYFRFVGYNPVIYMCMGYLYIYEKNKVFEIYFRFYLAFGVAYSVLYGSFYPPA